MKQYLILLAIVAVALAAFFLFRKTDGPDPSGTQLAGGQGALPGQQTRRPEVGQPRQGMPAGQVILPPEIEALQQALLEFSWEDTVTDETLVAMEDAWDFDLSGVDFEADVLCTLNGEPITQADYRRQAVLDYGTPLIKARMYHIAGQALAEKYGLEFGVTDEEFAQYFQVFCQERNMTEEAGRAFLSLTLRVPQEAAYQLRRELLEGLLAFFPPADFVEQLPEEVRAALDNDTKREAAIHLSTLLQHTRGNFGEGQNALAFTRAVDPMAATMSSAFEDQMFRRSWTCFDAEVPEGMYAGYVVGDLPNAVEPPWMMPGEVVWISTDEMYEAIEDALVRTNQEEELRLVLWEKALRQRLAKQGALMGPEEAWQAYAEEYLESKRGLIPFSFLTSSAYGYETLTHYRLAMQLFEGFKRSQPEGWDDEGVMRDFFTHHRFFIQRWQPVLDIAFFPPRDLSRSSGPGDIGVIDWDAARQRAEEFRAAVDRGEKTFDELLDAHVVEQYEQYRTAMGNEVAAQYSQQFRGGRLEGIPQTQIQQLLKNTQAQQFVDATSLLRNAVVRLEQNEVSPPWKTGIGYVVVRLTNARLGGLETEYEDVVEFTREEFYDTYFRLFVNETLTEAELVIP